MLTWRSSKECIRKMHRFRIYSSNECMYNFATNLRSSSLVWGSINCAGTPKNSKEDDNENDDLLLLLCTFNFRALGRWLLTNTYDLLLNNWDVRYTGSMNKGTELMHRARNNWNWARRFRMCCAFFLSYAFPLFNFNHYIIIILLLASLILNSIRCLHWPCMMVWHAYCAILQLIVFFS